MFFQTVKIALNGIPNICDGFIASLALLMKLRIATRIGSDRSTAYTFFDEK